MFCVSAGKLKVMKRVIEHESEEEAGSEINYVFANFFSFNLSYPVRTGGKETKYPNYHIS